MTTKKPYKVLILYSFRSHKTGYYKLLFDPLAERAGDFGMQLFQGSLKDLQICFKNNSLKIIESMTGMDLAEFDLVYFELFHKRQQQALVAAKYLDYCQISYFTPEVGRFTPLSKIGQQALMVNQNLPLPDGISTSAHHLRKLFRKNPPYSYPFILKSIQDFGGNNNFLIHNYAELKAKLTEHSSVAFIAQPFIANEFDYRVLILGGEIKLVMKRARIAEDTHLNNTSQNAEASIFDASVLTPKQREDSLKAARLVGREQFCGLDLLINKNTGEHIILEINEAPAIQLGADPEQKMQVLLEYMQRAAEEGAQRG